MALRITSPRRYYLIKRRHFGASGVEFSPSLSSAYRAKQEAEPGTALPALFPMKTELAVLGYEVVEDLDGADEQELTGAGLTARQAQAVITELAKILS